MHKVFITYCLYCDYLIELMSFSVKKVTRYPSSLASVDVETSNL